MRKNTGTRTVTTTNFVTYPDRIAAASAVWGPKFTAGAESLIADYAAIHLENDKDAHGYLVQVEVFEYELPGLRVVALIENDEVVTVFDVVDMDALRITKAARREQPVTITYTKADGEETVRTIEPTGLKLTKAGDVLILAMDRLSCEKRSFRLDRVSAYTVHRTRRTIRTEAPAPSKAALWAQFQAHAARTLSEDEVIAKAELDGRYVQDFRNGQTGVTEPGSRALSASGWSVTVRLTGAHRNATPSGTVRVSENHLVKITRKDVQEARALRVLNRARLARR